MNACLRLLGILALLLLATAVAAQNSPKKTGSPTLAVVTLRDGSTLMNVIILQDVLKVATKYGELTVPFAEVQRIDFGLHYPPDLEEKIGQSIGNLNSEVFQERAKATKYLFEVGYHAYPILKKPPKSQPLESEKRTQQLIKKIQEEISPELLTIKEYDVVITSELTIRGHVKGLEMKVQSKYLGEITLKFSDLCTIKGSAKGEWKFEVDAKYGNDPSQWLDTHISVSQHNRLVITAEGKVDLWPQGPGQYLTTPNGYTIKGSGSTFMAGALVGRIGAKGKVFLIGGLYDGTPSEEGLLFLQVAPSPWNNPSSGSYEVRIKQTQK